MKKFAVTMTLIVLGMAVLSACSSDKVMKQSELEKTANSAWVKAQPDQAVKSTTCAGELKGKVGATQKCTITLESGTVVALTATAAKVNDSTIDVNFTPDSPGGTATTTAGSDETTPDTSGDTTGDTTDETAAP